MIVTDLDGTYLRTDKSVSEYSLNVIEECRKRGIIFVIATARPVRAVEKFLPYVKYDSAIFHNGAVVRANNNQLSGFGIDKPGELILRIMDDFPNLNASVEICDKLYSNFNPSGIWKGIEYTPTNFMDLPPEKADKILIEASSIDEMKRYEKYLPEELYIQLSENAVAMIMNKNARKINAIKTVADTYGISLDNIVAFGDDYNDIEMLAGCGIGVAMGNAIDEVKTAADYICQSNDDDGMCKWLENNLKYSKQP